jgi:hypothetical protein
MESGAKASADRQVNAAASIDAGKLAFCHDVA